MTDVTVKHPICRYAIVITERIKEFISEDVREVIRGIHEIIHAWRFCILSFLLQLSLLLSSIFVSLRKLLLVKPSL